MQRIVVETGSDEDGALRALADSMKEVIAAAKVLNLKVTWGEIKTKTSVSGAQVSIASVHCAIEDTNVCVTNTF